MFESNTNKKMIVSGLSLLLTFILFLSAALTAQTSSQPKDKKDDGITHNVSVSVMLVPVFAVDRDGNPVHDLEKEDFEIYANGAPMKITNFIRFDFDYDKEVLEEVTVKEKKEPAPTPSRAKFIIIDSVFNEFFAFRRAKKIAVDIIRNGSPDDIYIVLENRADGGIRHLGGPGTPGKELIRRINKLKLPSAKWSKSLHWCQEWNYEADFDNYDPVSASANLENLNRNKKDSERLMYKNQVHHFSQSLARFKYALKTVTRPKMVFLLSEGISRGAFKNYKASEKVEGYGKFGSALMRVEERVSQKNEARDQRLFKDLERIVRAINEGGSVLYTVNPGKVERDSEASGEMSMRYLAYESGGQYIAGSDTKKLIKRLKKATAAYYELAFIPTPDLGKKIDLKLVCKRENVTAKTFKHTTRTRPYFRMEPVEKKLFALNMVTGGSWSRIMGKVVRIKYKKYTARKQIGNQIPTKIEVPLPYKMQGRELDIFAIRIDPQTQKADIQLATHKLNEKAELVFNKRTDKNEFFVIIEPVFAYCVYNQM
ncbi:MAG: hypothetical protein GY950_20830 [bacterium]|nr:hypothetical protein [bacterium]